MSLRRGLASLAALTILLFLAVPVRAEEIHQRLIDSQADSVVSLKFVLNVRMSGRGGSQDSERSGSTTGIVVDPVGLVVVPTLALTPRARFRGVEMTATPTSLRVIFPGDPKEYGAILGATDSRLGLSFVRIKDLEGKEIHAVDLENTVDPGTGRRAYGVSRLNQGFDYAPYCDDVVLAGRVTKPREMWLLRGAFTMLAHPLFAKEGGLLGFIVGQEGVGGGGTLPFLLPVKVVRSTVERAAREAERVLEEATESSDEEETGEEKPPADEEAGAESPEPPEKPTDEPGKDDGDR